LVPTKKSYGWKFSLKDFEGFDGSFGTFVDRTYQERSEAYHVLTM
jgi:hypothetical protein